MSGFSNFSAAAFLIADPTRAAMLAALLDGSALPAGRLADASGVTAQTASSHLAKLLEGGLIAVETQGRHRYYRLTDSHVAQTLEHLALIRPKADARAKMLSPHQRHLRFCRRCYDHMAGQMGVAVTRALLERDFIRGTGDKRFVVTEAGAKSFDAIGVNVAALKTTRRGLARQCLDWTERSHHLAGPLGVHLMRALCDQGWLRRSESSRAMSVTPKGWIEFKRSFGVTYESVVAPCEQYARLFPPSANPVR